MSLSRLGTHLRRRRLVGLGSDVAAADPEACRSEPRPLPRRAEGALAHLESRRQEINDLNVFPVADGDTGDNMALTLQACLEEVDRLAAVDRPLDEIGRDEIVESVARAALLGARGNSGVILSQLIRGAAEELVSRPASSSTRCSWAPPWPARRSARTPRSARRPRARC